MEGFTRLSSVLYDSEYAGGQNIDFFCHPNGACFQNNNEVKFLCDTNLHQCQMSSYPKKFEVAGIGVFLDRKISDEDFDALTINSYMEFCMRGNSPYMRQPLSIFPNLTRKREQNDNKTILSEVDLSLRDNRSIVPLISLDKNPIVINHGESFYARINWPVAPKFEKSFKIIVVVDGFVYLPR